MRHRPTAQCSLGHGHRTQAHCPTQSQEKDRLRDTRHKAQAGNPLQYQQQELNTGPLLSVGSGDNKTEKQWERNMGLVTKRDPVVSATCRPLIHVPSLGPNISD